MTSASGDMDRPLRRAATERVHSLHRLGIRTRDTRFTCRVENRMGKTTRDGLAESVTSFVPQVIG